MVIRAGALLLVVCVGCFDSRAEVCADGTICAPGQQCAAPEVGGCMMPAECDMAADGTACGATGACRGGQCVPAACGNGAVERAEACDDGNLRNHDGCSSTCASESPTWTQSSSAQPTFPAIGFAFDRMRGRALLFAGPTNPTTNETWEWDGAAWIKLTPAAMPSPARTQTMMAYDSVRKRIIMQGGIDTTAAYLADTWSWDGATWTRVATTGPGQLIGVGHAFDPNLGRVIVFGGGTNTNGTVDLTWSWDGTAWKQASPATVPNRRYRQAMATDMRARRVLMFAGDDFNGGALRTDTWSWDGTNWTQIMTTDHPTGRTTTGLAFDDASGVAVLYGGTVQATPPSAYDAWTFASNDWHKLAAPPQELKLDKPRLVFDPVREQFVLIGETAGSRQTWTLRFDYSGEPEETCIAGEDGDMDGLKDCADPDCWARCTPFCPPGAANCDPSAPHCGDGVCNALLETQVCPGDCP